MVVVPSRLPTKAEMKFVSTEDSLELSTLVASSASQTVLTELKITRVQDPFKLSALAAMTMASIPLGNGFLLVKIRP